MNKLKREDGVAHLFLLLLIVVALIGGVGYYVWTRQDDESDVVYMPAPSEPCEGEWYDTHTHLDEDEFTRDLADQMREYKVGCSLMFVQVDTEEPDISLLEIREEFAPNPGRFVLFGDVIGDDIHSITKQKLEKVMQVYGDKLKGLGEFAFYNPPFKGTSLEAEPWPTVFEFAGDNDLFVMLHLTENEADSIDTMLSRYPKTKVLMHHSELNQDLPDLLKKHKNLYYTLDTTNLTSIKQSSPLGGDFYETTFFPPKSNDAEDFLGLLANNKQTILKQAPNDWLDVFEAAPDRVMWGTDAALDWHLETDVYSALMEFSESFVSKIPEQYRSKYMKQNAMEHFGAAITLDDLTEAEYDRLDNSGHDDDEESD